MEVGGNTVFTILGSWDGAGSLLLEVGGNDNADDDALTMDTERSHLALGFHSWRCGTNFFSCCHLMTCTGVIIDASDSTKTKGGEVVFVAIGIMSGFYLDADPKTRRVHGPCRCFCVLPRPLGAWFWSCVWSLFGRRSERVVGTQSLPDITFGFYLVSGPIK